MYPSPKDRRHSLPAEKQRTEERHAGRNFFIGALLFAAVMFVLGWDDFAKAKSVGENLSQLFLFMQVVVYGGMIGTLAAPVWREMIRSGWFNPGAGDDRKEIEFCEEQLRGIDADIDEHHYTEEARHNYVKTREHFAERLRLATAREKLSLAKSKDKPEKKIQKQSNDEF